MQLEVVIFTRMIKVSTLQEPLQRRDADTGSVNARSTITESQEIYLTSRRALMVVWLGVLAVVR
jgi:hypothetical protein